MKSLSYKISDKEFKAIIRNSTSCADAMRKIGYNCVRGNASKNIKKRILELNIDTSHWKNKYQNMHKAITLSVEEYFVNGKDRNGSSTRKKLIKENLIPYKCAICGNTGEWNGHSLILQVDHINGKHDDNRLENLRFLCPNCHSQTNTFAGKNIKIRE